jgi:anti-sigma factor RsiW
MKSLLDQLDPEAILILYIAGELSPADRQEVERRLQTDGTLRAQLREIQSLHESFEQAMQSADQNPAHTIPDGVAIRRTSRLMRQWVAQRRTPEIPVEIRESIPWLRYGLSAAAVLLLAGGIWYRMDMQPAPTIAVIPAPVANSVSSDEKLTMFMETMDTPDDAANQQVAALAGGRADDTDFSAELLNQNEAQ